jgi:hypothetical protein
MTIRADGTIRVTHRRDHAVAGYEYRAWIVTAPGDYRWTRRAFVIEADARAWGIRLAERWNRIYAKQP